MSLRFFQHGIGHPLNWFPNLHARPPTNLTNIIYILHYVIRIIPWKISKITHREYKKIARW